MFEYDQVLVNDLLSQDVKFRSLYEKHQNLDRRVGQAANSPAISNVELSQMKKEKLLTRDQMAVMIDVRRREQTI